MEARQVTSKGYLGDSRERLELEEIVSFLNRFGKERQFFPVYTEEDFSCEYTRDFSPADFYVAIQNGRIIGVLGKWDQNSFKQNIITGYAGYLKTFRHPINLALTAVGFKALPRPGEQLRMFFVSFVCIKDDDPQVLEKLLEALYQDNKTKGYHYCVIGFHERDDLQEGSGDMSNCSLYEQALSGCVGGRAGCLSSNRQRPNPVS